MMNSNTISRHPAGPVRQYSLQQPPRHQHSIRRQRSTEDEKNKKSIHPTSSAGFRNRFSGNSCISDSHHHMPVLDRPRVRMAWSEQPDKSKNDGGVEIIARQIQTEKLNRPTTGRDNKSAFRRCPLGEKPAIPYSRQELAERLRLAWKQREENKANIDIFLAQNTMGDRCDSGMSTETNLTTQSTPKLQEKNLILGAMQTPIKKIHKNDTNDFKKEKPENEKVEKINGHEFRTWFPSNPSKKTTTNVCETQISDNHTTKTSENKRNDDERIKNETEQLVVEKKPSININCHNWNTSIIINNKNEVNENSIEPPSPTSVRKEPDYSQAKLKRANYQSGTNKAFVTPIIEKPSTPTVTSRNNTCHKATQFRRTSSAPPQRRTQMSIVAETPTIPAPTTNSESVKWTAAVNDRGKAVCKGAITTNNRPIKSAPAVKRRSKTNKKRSLSVTYSRDGDDEAMAENSKGRIRHAKTGKNMLEAKSTDVVTMVSLISSADSESEMDEISSRDDKLIHELRNKLPTTPIIKSSNGLSGGNKKPFKSVSFQQDSFDLEESTPQTEGARDESRISSRTRSFALNKAGTGSSYIITGNTSAVTLTVTSKDVEPPPILGSWRPSTYNMAPIRSEIKLTCAEAMLTDREKRCLAVPIGDIHDKKRKLLRCRSATITPTTKLTDTNQTCLPAEMRMSEMTSRASPVRQENNPLKIGTNPFMPNAKTDTEKNKNFPTESYCQTPKEKECWHLYRRMCDKGVFVSFDTVLRGMLTPTEYRLRQKEMSQNCC